ncbi:MAG: nicotinate (nicotinamide) nucleotide adenylyltransferase [Oscillospiraceae bacterium]|nr:nicotinate (nicotinamide) nucleotide adenylyltransferase [Oscillospiraceae bacterium]
MKIAIYGGSFNPPHIGHVAAAQSVYEQLKPDRFLIIPTNVSPHKTMEDNSPQPMERLEMCRLAFGHIPGVEISDMEIRREGKSYTATTVEELRREYPEDEICLVMGTDMFLSFRTWYRYQYLLENVTLAVLSREAYDTYEIEQFKAELERENDARVEIIPHQVLPMSSTEIRERLRLGLGSDLLPDQVYSYIVKMDYYDAKPELSWLREKVMPYIHERRIAHCTGCESQAVLLAMHWGEDPDTAAIAGILHDITKNMDKDKQLLLCEKYGIILDNYEAENPALLHARTGAALAKDLFGISDEIYEAIRWHTTGKPDMTRLEQIIYLADFTEPTRDFEGVDVLRELSFENLDDAMALGLSMSLGEIRARGAEPFGDTLEAYLWYTSERGEN